MKRRRPLSRTVLYTLDLADKPIGYGVGFERCVVKCPRCDKPGARLSPNSSTVLHAIEIVEVRRLTEAGGIRSRLEISRKGACVLNGKKVFTEEG